MAGVWDQDLNSNFEPKGKLYAFPSLSLDARAPPTRTKLLNKFWVCSFLAPKSPKISKIGPSNFNLNFGSIFGHIYSNLLSFWSSKSFKNWSKIELWIKNCKNRKTFENHSFYNGFRRYGSEKNTQKSAAPLVGAWRVKPICFINLAWRNMNELAF